MNRIYIFTGKGGVGKTSIAASMARKSELDKKKTLLVSTDMAHNLGDIFEVTCGKKEVKISDYLDILEIDPEYVMENEYSEMINAVSKIIANGNENIMEDIGMIPGMEELFSLLKINDLYKKGKYERIIVDCAPTGETLSLLKIPELLSWYMEKLFPIGKVAVRVMAPVTKTFMKIELPNKQAMNDIEKIYYKLYELQTLLKDPEITSIRLVAVPEKMVVEESRRNYMYMNLYNFHVDEIYINRVFPKDLNNSFFDRWKTIQSKYIDEIKEDFGQLSMCQVPWFGEEVKGIDAIDKIANEFLPDDIFESRECTEREKIVVLDTGYELQVFLPNVKKEDVDVYKADNSVVIKINNFKRNILLPDSLRQYDIVRARVESDVLKLTFEKLININGGSL